jgi:murein DD-endopeptidase MepM/ murein hydrolase activator NlpD
MLTTAPWRRIGSGFLPIIVAYAIAVGSFTSHHKWRNDNKTPPSKLQKLQSTSNSAPASLLAQLPQTEMRALSAGETLLSLLRKTSLSAQDSHYITQEINRFIPVKKLPTGQQFHFQYRDRSGKRLLTRMTFSPSFGVHVKVSRTKKGAYTVRHYKAPLEEKHVLFSGEIRSSLYACAHRQGVPWRLLQTLVQSLGHKFDLQRDIKQGDTFKIVCLRQKDTETGKTLNKKVLGIALNLKGKDNFFYAFKPNGTAEEIFLDDRGKGLKSKLLRTPLHAARLTSNFGYRVHPILGYTRLHKGVDFAAPKGTPVMAAGSGKVIKAGYNGHYGNYILIRHNANYSTAYAHLQKYHPSVHKNAQVKQGAIIGYVGNTGRTTAPHLHFELHKNGKPINPKHLKGLPSSNPEVLSPADLKRFFAHKQKIDTLYRL